MRQLSKLRERATDLAFETKMRSKNGRKRWGVIVAERSKLLYDQCSLFYDHQGRRLHNYTTLGKGGMKIRAPKGVSGRKSSQHVQSAMISNAGNSGTGYEAGAVLKLSSTSSSGHKRVCDLPSNRKDSEGIQQFKSYGAERDMGSVRGDAGCEARLNRFGPLRRKAFALMEVLAREHWDNCKVVFSRRSAFCFAWEALLDGHDAESILSCYAQSLFICHGLATDMGCRVGKHVFFNLSSTVAKSRRMLYADGLSPSMRMARWYERRSRNRSRNDISPPGRSEPIPFPSDAAELRRLISESLGCVESETAEAG